MEGWTQERAWLRLHTDQSLLSRGLGKIGKSSRPVDLRSKKVYSHPMILRPYYFVGK